MTSGVPTRTKPLYLLVRHFPTGEDVQRRYSDPDAEVPLLEVDTHRAEGLCRSVQALLQDRSTSVYASCTQRGIKTAQMIADFVGAQALSADDRLSNIRHPHWNGLTQDDVRNTELYRQWHSDPTSVAFPDGERLVDVQVRLSEFLASLPNEHDVIIVSHSTALQVLACLLLEIPASSIWSFYFEPYAVTAVVGHVLVRMNGTDAVTLDYRALYE